MSSRRITEITVILNDSKIHYGESYNIHVNSPACKDRP